MTANTVPAKAKFQIPPSMTKTEVKEYLTKIYDVDVLNVNTLNVLGKHQQEPIITFIHPAAWSLERIISPSLIFSNRFDLVLNLTPENFYCGMCVSSLVHYLIVPLISLNRVLLFLFFNFYFHDLIFSFSFFIFFLS
jgi:hypothetical protein